MYLNEFAPSLEQFKKWYIHKIFPVVECWTKKHREITVLLFGGIELN